MPTAARILWRSAGSPLREGVGFVAEPSHCWWCGLGGLPFGRVEGIISPDFPDRVMAKAGKSPLICAACAWTLNERARIPAAYAAKRMATLCATGRRMQGVLRGASGKWVALLLESGKIGLWSVGPTAASEDPWKKAIPALRVAPADVGPCHFLEAVDPVELEPDASEKFRNYHHFGGESLPWEVATDSDKARIRDRLFRPPVGEYVAAIGDGQKHAVIYAEPGFGPDQAAVYFRPAGLTIFYHPSRLIRLVDAVELMVAAGCDDDELVAGVYRRVSVPLILARKQTDLILSEHRGSAIFDLALYLRRTRPELKEDQALAARLCPPTPPPGPERDAPIALVDSAGNDARSGPIPEPAPSVAEPVSPRRSDQHGDDHDRDQWPVELARPRQLSLFGR